MLATGSAPHLWHTHLVNSDNDSGPCCPRCLKEFVTEIRRVVHSLITQSACYSTTTSPTLIGIKRATCLGSAKLLASVPYCWANCSRRRLRKQPGDCVGTQQPNEVMSAGQRGLSCVGDHISRHRSEPAHPRQSDASRPRPVP